MYNTNPVSLYSVKKIILFNWPICAGNNNLIVLDYIIRQNFKEIIHKIRIKFFFKSLLLLLILVVVSIDTKKYITDQERFKN